MSGAEKSDAAPQSGDPTIGQVPLPPSYVRGQGRLMWDAFGSRWVDLVGAEIIQLPENEGIPGKHSFARRMLYLHEGHLFYVHDPAPDEATPPGAPGELVDPRRIWPACTGHITIANDSVFDLKGSTEDEEESSSYYKRINPLRWSPRDDQTIQYFENEFRLYEHLQKHPHPNFCEYRGCLTEAGFVTTIVIKRYAYTLETAYREGVRTGSVTLDGSRILAQVRSALDHLHSLGVAHNDVNPYNILVEEDGNTAVLGDLDASTQFGMPLGKKRGTMGFCPPNRFGEESCMENDEYGFGKVVEFVDSMEELAAKGQLTSTITYIGSISRAEADRREEQQEKQWEDRQREAYELSMKQGQAPVKAQ